MSRKLNNWLAGYLEMVENTEPAQRFHLWVAITLVGAMLGRKCTLQFGPEELFPNFYTVLCGPSGIRKGAAIRYGEELLEELGASIARAPDVITRQELYNLLERNQAVEEINGKQFLHSSVLVIAHELVLFMGENDLKRLGDMCHLYDGRPTFEYSTKSSGRNFVVNPALWLLGATTPQWIEQCMPQLGIGGGATSRIIFVYAASKGKHIPFSNMADFDKELREKVIHDLHEIRCMKGSFEMSKEAEQFYAQWYGTSEENSVYQKEKPLDMRLHSFWNRVPMHIVKVAMVLSASRGDSMVIEKQDVENAIQLIRKIMPDMHRAFGSFGMNPYAPQTQMLRDLLREKGSASRSYILKSLGMHIDEWSYERIKSSLIAERFCVRTFDMSTMEEVLVLREIYEAGSDKPVESGENQSR